MRLISPNMTYREATKSSLAIRHGLDNTPPPDVLKNMKNTARRVFEPTRMFFGVPIIASSFYRSPEVNILAGGSESSDHCTGEAIDMDADVLGGITNEEIFKFIYRNLDYDQLIWEFFNEDGTPAWVHASFCANGRNRHQTLLSKKSKEGTVYIIFEDTLTYRKIFV